jgi:hypothetical protein
LETVGHDFSLWSGILSCGVDFGLSEVEVAVRACIFLPAGISKLFLQFLHPNGQGAHLLLQPLPALPLFSLFPVVSLLDGPVLQEFIEIDGLLEGSLPRTVPLNGQRLNRLDRHGFVGFLLTLVPLLRVPLLVPGRLPDALLLACHDNIILGITISDQQWEWPEQKAY